MPNKMTEELHAYTHDVEAEIRSVVYAQLIREAFNREGIDVDNHHEILKRAINEAGRTLANYNKKDALNLN